MAACALPVLMTFITIPVRDRVPARLFSRQYVLPNRWLANDQKTPSKDYFVIAETGLQRVKFLACRQLLK